MWEHAGTVATVIMVVFSIATTVAGVLVRQALLNMRIELGATQAALTSLIGASRKEIDDRVEQQGRIFGEVAAAVRQKVHELELFCRDTYVRRDSFYKVSDDMAQSVQVSFDKIEKRLERMETKIDSKT